MNEHCLHKFICWHTFDTHCVSETYSTNAKVQNIFKQKQNTTISANVQQKAPGINLFILLSLRECIERVTQQQRIP